MARITAGEKMPNFTFETNAVKSMTMEEVVGGKPTCLVVLRYIGCTVCRYDVYMLTQRINEFKEKGANVAVMMQSKPEIVNRDLKGEVLPFPLICDYNLDIYKALDIQPARSKAALVSLLDLPKLKAKGDLAKKAGFEHGDYEGIEEQLPAFFLLDGDMTVKEAHYGKGIMDMPTIDEMLAKL